MAAMSTTPIPRIASHALFRDRASAWRHAVVLALVLAFAMPVLFAPTEAAAQEKSEKDKKAKDKDKPGKKVEPLISQLPGLQDESRCQAEIAVIAYKKLGALMVLSYMPSELANAAASGASAATGYCAQNPKLCSDSADALMPRIGQMPTICGG